MGNDRQRRAERAEQMRRERERADRRRRNVLTLVIAVVVVALIVIGALAVRMASTDDDREVVQPRNTTDDHGIVIDTAVAEGEPTTVEIYEDFQCPVCRAFEEAAGAYLDAQVEAGAITLVHRPFSFLDGVGGSTNRYSHRSTNAALCVLDHEGVPAYRSMHRLLFANQPEEGTAGPSDDELVELAAEAGTTGIDECVTSERFVPWVDEAMRAGEAAGVGGTPTVLVDGAPVESAGGGAPGLAELQAAIAAAKG